MKKQFDKLLVQKVSNPIYIDRQVEELLTTPNPYHVLMTKNALMEQYDRLNGLHPNDVKHLVFRIVANCPTSDLEQYCHLVAQFIKAPREINSEESSTSDSTLETPFFNALFNALKIKKQLQANSENDIDTCYSYTHLTHTDTLFIQCKQRKHDPKLEYIVLDLECDGIMNIVPDEMEEKESSKWCHLF